MAIVPSGYELGLQNAGTDITVVDDPQYLSKTITSGSTTMNTMQAWTDIAYTPFGGSTYYTTYVKDLTGGDLYGYSPTFNRTAWGYISPGHGASGSAVTGPAGLLSIHDGTGPAGGSSGTYYSSSTTYSGNGVMGSQPAALFGGPPWGFTPTTVVGAPGQFHESFTQTYTYQGRAHNGYGINISNNTTSIGSFGGSSYDNQHWTGSSGIKWNVQQVLWGKNTKSTGNFPSMNGPYSGSHETGSNAGNFVFLFITRSDGNTVTDLTAAGYTAEQVFSHMKIGTSTTVFKSNHSGVSHSPGFTGISTSRAGIAGYTANAALGFYYFWQGVSDNVIDNLGTTGNVSFTIYGPRTTLTYTNGIAEEHGGDDSNNVKISDYIKGGEYVSIGNSSSTIPSSLLDVSFSNYQLTEDDGVPAGSTGVFVDSASNGDYYPYRGAAVYGASVDYVYGSGLAASAAYGAFVPSTTAARTFVIDGTNQILTEASIAYATPNGTNFIARFTPASGSSNDLMATGDWSTITLTKTNNTNHSNTLTLTTTSQGYSYNTTTTAAASGQIIPTALLSFITNSPSTSNNYIYNWITDNGTKTSIQDFTITIS
jgi:hypothetical protein